MRNTLMAALMTAGMLMGQDFRASVVGRVTDGSGAAVPMALVTATNNGTGFVTRTNSTSTGDYTITGLAPGVYQLTVEMKGFKKFVQDKLTLAIQERPTIDVTLEPGDVLTSVTVTSDAAVLETSTASRGELISGRTLVDMPLNGRNAFALAGLAPGVAVTARGQASTFLRPTANLGISSIALSGSQPRQNEALLDGIPNTGSDGLIQFVPSIDATQEFKVQTNSFDAEYGRFTGGVINAMIKSGTNEFHGAGFWFVRNSAFNARDPFSTSIPQFGYNLFGVSAGAPVIIPKLYNGRNRTFWFWNYEGSREGVPRAFVSSVPTELHRAGNFSQTRLAQGPVTIYDPSTTRQVGAAWQRDPFPGNVVPQSAWDPVARNLLALYPLPNNPGNAVTAANNFLLSFKDLTGDDGYVIKVDHRFSDGHAMFARFSLRNWYVTRQGAFKNPVTGDVETRDAPGFALDDTYTINPTTVLNLRYGFTRFFVNARSDNYGADLRGLGFPQSFVQALPVQAIPQISISGMTALSAANKLNRSAENAHTLRGALTRVSGRHTMKFGAEGRLLQSNVGSLGSAAAGSFNFDTVFTRGPNPQVANATAGFGLASFLLGLGPSGSVANNAATADSLPYYGFYAQDDIRLGRKLTLNLGLRYEWEGGYTERYNRLNRGFDSSTDLPIAAQAKANYALSPVPDVPPSQFQVRGGLLFAGVMQPEAISDIQRTNLAPRVGAAYQLNSRTVLRGGYGIFYGAGTLSGEARNGFSVSTPYVGTINGSLTPVNRLSNPYPDGLLQPIGSSQGLMTLTGQGISFTAVDRQQPLAQQYQFGVQRQLGATIMAEVAYAGSVTSDVALDRQINFIPAAVRDAAENTFRSSGRNILNDSAANPFRGGLITGGALTGATTTRGQLTRPYPQFTSVVAGAAPLGNIRYDSLQAKFTKRFSAGFSFLGAYTWMKQLERTRFLNDQDLAPVKELSDFDYGHRFTLSGAYELPFGPGKRFFSGSSSLMQRLMGGWQLNGIYIAQGGVPLTVGGAQSLGRSAKLENPTVGRWFDTTAFRQLETLEQVGTSRLPDVRSAGKNNVDLSVYKTTQITEVLKLQFRVESFNTFNRPEYSSPATSFGVANFGVVTSTNTFARQLQFGLKLLW
ncbi:MAG: TonB-dependent receptor [Bryobacterales bacterium]|nr:TonB-dependent receptor [Bryobacterales bacterium]